jgi:serine/threonine protein kinase
MRDSLTSFGTSTDGVRILMLMRRRPAAPPTRIGSYQRLQLIGQGATADVYLALHTKTNCQVALKIIPKRIHRTASMLEALQRESRIASSLDHPFIMCSYERLEDDDFWYLAAEYLEGGTLMEYIASNTSLEESEACRIFDELVSAIYYLHKDKQIMHRDLKPQNILLDKHMHIRLIDFGFANQFTYCDPLLSTPCGSPVWSAPEILTNRKYTTSADIWSLGTILFFMVAGWEPFHDKNTAALAQKIIQARPAIPPFFSANLQDLVRRLLEKDPEQRCAIPEILRHPWMEDATKARFSYDDNAKLHELKICEAVHELDQVILSEMEQLGYQTQGIETELQSYHLTDRTAAYKMLKRRNADHTIHNWRQTRASATQITFSMELGLKDGTGIENRSSGLVSRTDMHRRPSNDRTCKVIRATTGAATRLVHTFPET